MIRNNPKYSSSFGFIDLLFNLLVGFVFLFFIAYLLINPIAKQGVITPPDKILINATWEDKSNADIDLWMEDPEGNVMSFQNKVIPGAHLEKDDLGESNDAIWVNGKRVVSLINSETIHIQGLIPGDYYITVHAYNLRNEGAKEVDINLKTLDPYRNKANRRITLTQSGQEKCIWMFTISPTQKIVDVQNCSRQLVVGKLTQEYNQITDRPINNGLPPSNTRIP